MLKIVSSRYQPLPTDVFAIVFQYADVDCRGETLRLDLSGETLSGDFSGANFNYANLECTRFVRATLDGATFTSANLRRTDFSGAKMNGVSFDGRLDRVRFCGSILINSSFIGVLTGVKFGDADLTGADLSETNIDRPAQVAGAVTRSTKFAPSLFKKRYGRITWHRES